MPDSASTGLASSRPRPAPGMGDAFGRLQGFDEAALLFRAGR